jgi:hypothetical protein
MTRHLWILALALAAPAWAADDKEKTPVERTTNDRQILNMLTELHDKGAAMYDAGDVVGCYRLFQGGLTAVRILLPKELQQEIDGGLADASRMPAMSQRAMLLHTLIEDVRKKLHKTAGPKQKGSLLHPPRPVTAAPAPLDPVPPPKSDKAVKTDPPANASPVGPAVVPVNTPSKGTPAPVTTAPPSDDPPITAPKLPFTPIIPKPDGK